MNTQLWSLILKSHLRKCFARAFAPACLTALLGMAVWSCNQLESKPLAIDQTFVFKGLNKLTPSTEGTWILNWDSIPASGVAYSVFSAPEGKLFDFTSPLKTTTESTYETDDLRFQESTCFMVRFKRDGKKDDSNTSTQCTKHKKILFSGITDSVLNADGTYTLSWPKIIGKDLTVRILENKSRTMLGSDPQNLANVAAAEGTFTSKVYPFGEKHCFAADLVRGSKVVGTALETNDINTPCTPTVDFGDFRGVESVKRSAPGEALVTWKAATDSLVAGYIVKDLSALDATTKLPTQYVLKDRSQNSLVVKNIDDTTEHQFTVQAVNANQLADANNRTTTLAPKNDDIKVAGEPVKVQFAVQAPALATSNVNFSTNPQVEIVDAKGVRNTLQTNPILLQAYSDANCTTSVGTGFSVNSAVVQASGGVSAFDGVRYSKIGNIYLGASAAGLTSACSNAIQVTAANPTKLAYFLQPPSNAAAGVQFTAYVQILDDSGNLVKGALNAVSFGAYSDNACTMPATGVLAATPNPSVPSQGVALFSATYNQAGAIYIKASSTGLTEICSSAATTVSAGGAANIRIKTQPSGTAVAGSLFTTQPAVEVIDGTGNVVTSATTSISLYAYLNPTCSQTATGVVAANSVAANAGTATFTGVGYSKKETIYLRAEATIGGSLKTDCAAATVVSAGAPAKLAFFVQPPAAGASVNNNFPTQPAIEVQDASGNRVSSAASSIQLTAYSDSSCSTQASYNLSATTNPLTAVAGLASFATVRYPNPETIYLQASSAALTSACSLSVTVVGAAAQKLSFTALPTTATAGVLFSTQPQVTVLDGSNTPTNSGSPSVSLGVFSDPGCRNPVSGVLQTTSNPLTGSAGVANFTGVSYNKPGTIYLYASSTGSTDTCSSAVSVSAGSASKLAFATQPSTTANANADFVLTPIVEVRDAGDNKILGATDTVALQAYSDATCSTVATGVLSATALSSAAVSGSASYTNLKYSKTGTVYLKATSGSLSSACSTAVAVAAGSPAKLGYVLNPSSSAISGNTFTTQPQVAVQDSQGNTVVAATDAISLSAFTDNTCATAAPGGALGVGSNPVAAVSGVASYGGVSYTQTGTIYLKAASGSLTAACFGPITVSAGSGTKLAFSTQPSANANAASVLATQPSVQALDSSNNIVTSATPTITLRAFADSMCTVATNPDITATANPVVASSGVSTFAGVTYPTTGTIYLRAAAAGYTAACSNAIALTAGAASKLVFTTQPSSTTVAGAVFGTQPAVAIQDSAGNTLSSATNTVTLASYSDTTCATATLGATLQGTVASNAVAGMASYTNLKFNKSGSIYLKATSGALTSVCSQAVAVATGSPSKLTFLVNPSTSVTANGVWPTQPQVDIRDANDNWVTTFASPTFVTLAAFTDSSCASPAAGSINATSNPISATGGIASFAATSYSQAGAIYLQASASSLTPACYGPLAVAAGSATKLSFSTQPSASGTAGTALATPPVVQILDSSNSISGIATNSVQLTAYSDPDCSTSTGFPIAASSNPVTASSGVATFASVSYARTGTVYLKASSSGLTSACSAAVSIGAASATKLTFTTQPSSTGNAGIVFVAQPVVQFQDAGGNLVSSAAGVTLAMYTDAACTTAAATGTITPSSGVTASGGVLSFSGVKFTGAGSFYIKASSGALTPACSQLVQIAPGTPATTLAFLQQPSSSGNAGQTLSVQPQVVVKDDYGNTYNVSNDVITLTVYKNAGCTTAPTGTLSTASNPVTASNGVASFTGVAYSIPETISLKATAPGLIAACSNVITISAGNATRLAFSTQPSSTGTAGTAFAVQPLVEIRDSSSNVVTSATDAVQLTAYTDSGCSTPATGTFDGGPLTVSASSGVVTYSGLRYSAAATLHLKATASGFTSACSNSITVSAGGAAKLAFQTQPSGTALSGSSFSSQPLVSIQDAQGNLVSTATNSVTLLAYSDSACSTAAAGTLSGGAALAAASGVATFTTANYSKTGSIYLKANSGALAGVCSNLINVSAGAATKIAFLQQPSSTATSVTTFIQQPQIAVQDANGNTVSSASDSISLAIYSEASCSSAASMATFTAGSNPIPASSGVAGFTGVSYGAVGTFYLKATSGSLTSVCSNAVAVSAGSASKLAFTTQPSATGSAGSALAMQPVVQVQDGGGAVVPSSSAPIQLTAYSDSGCSAPASGSLTASTNPLSASSGVATFAGVTFNKAATIYLKATASGFTAACSNPIAVTYGAAITVAFTTQPAANASANVSFPTQPLVEIRDAQGNIVGNASNNVTVATYSDSSCSTTAAGTLSGTTLVAASAGAANFAGLKYNQSGTVYLKASAASVAGTVCSNVINVAAGTPTKLAYVLNPSSTATSGNTFTTQPQIAIQDAQSNLVNTATDTVTLAAFTDAGCSTAAPGGALGMSSNPVAAVGGMSTFSGVSYSQSGTIYLKAGSGSLTVACYGPINVTAGSATKLVFATQPSLSASAGSVFTSQPVVNAVDNSNNLVTSATPTITLKAYTDAVCTVVAAPDVVATTNPVAASGGVATFASTKYNSAMSIYLRASAPGYTSACSNQITVSAGTASQLAFSIQPAATAVAGTTFSRQPEVSVQDAGGNTITSASDLISLAAYTDASCTTATSSTLQGTVSNAAVGGVASFAGLNFTKAQTIYLKATNATLSKCSDAITVSPGSSAKLTYLVNPPSSGTANSALSTQPQVDVRDANDNWVTLLGTPVFVSLGAYTENTCTTTAAGAVSAVSNPLTAGGGIANFSGVTYSQAGSIYLKASASGLTAACFGPIAIAAGSATKLAFGTQPSATATAGTAFATSPVVQIQDSSSGVVSSATNTVQLLVYSDFDCSTPTGFSLAATSNPVTASSGVATFANAIYTRTGTVYLKATSLGLTSACSAAVNVSAASATKLAFSAQPALSGTVDVALTTQPVVQFQDAAGNLASTTNSVTLAAYSDSTCATAATGTITPAGATAAVGGSVAYSTLKFTGAGIVYLKASSGVLTSACSSAVTLSPGAAATLAYLQQPASSGTAGQTLSVQPQIVVKDTFGNLVSSANDLVTLSVFSGAGCSTAPTGALTTGSNPVAAANGVAGFTSVSYSVADTISLLASAPSRTAVCSNSITVSAGNASRLAFSVQPSATATSGANYSTQPKIEIRDNSNNVSTAATDTVTLAAYSDAGCSTPATGSLGGTLGVAASSGVVTYSGIKFNGTGLIYFKASSGTYTSACSTLTTVSAGTATKVAFSAQPSITAAAGVAIAVQPVVAIQDAQGNTVPSANDTVTLTTYSDATCSTLASGGTLTGGGALAAVSGLSSFSTVNYSKAGTVYLKATSGTLATTCSTGIAVSAGAVTKLAFLQQPSSTTTALQLLGAQPQVALQDAVNNTVPAASDAVTLSVYTDASCLTLGSAGAFHVGSNPVTASGGVANFTGISYDLAGSLYLKASSGSYTSACSNLITVSAASATKLAFSTQPSATGSAGTAFSAQPVVQAQDAGGTLSTSATPAVQLTAYSDSGCSLGASGTLNATTNPLSATAGVATFAGVGFNKTGTIYLKATASGYTAACSNAIAVTYGSVSSVAFAPQPSATAAANAIFPTQPSVEIRDSSGNLVANATNNVALAAYSNPTCTTAVSAPGTLSGTISQSATAGLSAYSTVQYNQAETIYLKATGTSVATTACSTAVTVGAGTATKLAFAQQPSTAVTAGNVFAQQPQVLVQDAAGNTVLSGSARSVTLKSYSDNTCSTAITPTTNLSVGSNPVATASGAASFTGVSYSNSGSLYLAAETAGLTSVCSNLITVSVGASSKLAFSTQPSTTGTAGVTLTTPPQVQLQDAGGNLVTIDTKTVVLTAFSDAACSVTSLSALSNSAVATTSGVSAFSTLTYPSTGTVYLRATATGLTPACSNGISFAAAAKYKLAFSVQPTATGLAGTNFATQPAVDVQDAFGNKVANATDNITLAAYLDSTCTTTAASGSLTVTINALPATAGTAAFSAAKYDKVETIYIRATAPGLTLACSTPIAVSAGVATKVVFSLQPSSSATTGTALATQPQIQIQDANNNLVTAGSQTATLTAYLDSGCTTTAAAGGKLSVSNSGSATSGGVLGFTGVGYADPTTIYLKAISGSLAFACSNAVVVSAGSASKLAFTTQPFATGTTGLALTTQPIVQVQDSGGTSSNNGGVAVSIQLTAYVDSGCSTPVSGTLSATTNPLNSNTTTGATGFAGLAYNRTGTIYLKASASGFSSACSNGVTLSAGSASQIAFTTQPASGAIAGAALSTQPNIEVQDSVGNRVSSATNAVTLAAFTDSTCATAVSGGTFTPSSSLAAVAGLATFTTVSYTKASTIYLKATAVGIGTSICSSAIVVAPATSTKLSFLVNPSGTGAAGSNLASQPQVDLRDQYDNWVSSAAPTSVTLAPKSAADCSGVDAAGALAATSNPALSNAGIAGFSGVNYSQAGTIYLKASSGALTIACSPAVVVSAGSASKLAFSVQPSATGAAGTALGTPPRVEVRDSSNNISSSANNSVTLAAYADLSCTSLATGNVTATTNPVSASSGLAVFAGVSYTKSGTVYFKASSAGLASDCSAAVAFSAGAAASVRFAQQPAASGVSNTILSIQPTVEILDAANNRLTTNADNIVLSAFTDSACTATASGTFSATATTVATTSGLSSFAGVKYTKAENIYIKATFGAFTACSTAISVAPGAASQIAFQQQPSTTAVTNSALGSQPQIVIRDVQGNTVPSASTSITLTAYTDVGCSSAAAVGALSAPGNPSSAVSGVSSFSGLKFTATGTFYLGAAGTSVGTACSNAITVSAPVSYKLAFNVQPNGTAIVGNSFTTNPWVEVQDVTGARVSTATDSITLAAYTDSSCATAVGTPANLTTSSANPLAASGGLASFTGTGYAAAATIYLKATSGSLLSACSNAINVSAATPTLLAFTTQPSSTATVGTNFSVQPRVEVRDAAGGRVTNATNTISLLAFTDASCATAAVGSLTAADVAASAGVSVFANVKYGKSETIYLKASSGALTTACSAAVQVAPGAPSQLTFFVQPSATAYTSAAFSTSPQVQVSDVGGNWVQTASNVVTIAAFTNAICTTAATGTLTAGGNPVGAAGGMASFSSVQYSAAATVYLQASASGLTSACSTAVAVSAALPTSLSFSGQPSSTASVGNPFSAQPRVDVLDNIGNRMSGANTTDITLAAYSDSGCSTAVGTPSNLTANVNPLTSSFGSSSFSGVTYLASGTIYLKATATGLISACSTPIAVSSLTANKVAFFTLPSNTGSAGVALTTQPSIEIQSSGSVRVYNSTASVVLGAYTDIGCSTTAPGVLSATGGLTQSAVQGRISYSGITYSQSGNIYLGATSSGLTMGCSSVIAVNAGPVTAALTITNPAGTTSNSTSVNVTVGGTSVATYYYFLLASNSDCVTGVNWGGVANGSYIAVATPISGTIATLSGTAGSDGTYTLCVKGKDASNNIQTTVTRYQWTKKTVPPTATINNAPSDPSSGTNLNVTVSGTSDLYTYQYALMAAANCTGASYSAARAPSVLITDAIGSSGIKTLCVKGIDVAGNVQSTATAATWTQTGSWPARGMIIVESVSDTQLKPRWAAVSGATYKVAAQAGSNYPGTDCSGGTTVGAVSSALIGASQTVNLSLSASTQYSVRVCESTDSGSTWNSIGANYTTTFPSGQSETASLAGGLGTCLSTATSATTCTLTATVVPPEGVTIYSPGNITVGSGYTLGNGTTSFHLAIEGDLTLGSSGTGKLLGTTLRVLVRNLTMASGTAGEISTVGYGYAAAAGACPGLSYSSGSASGGGGSHAGMGGTSGASQTAYGCGYGAATSPDYYGNFARPTSWGSGGGDGYQTSRGAGGAGGGAIYIVATSTLTMNSGTFIRSDGASGTAAGTTTYGGGGGAGGSVWIDAGAISGTAGTISAAGGAGAGSDIALGGAGGGGGRIAVHFGNSVFTGTYSTAGGTSSRISSTSPSTPGAGAPGTVFQYQKGGNSTLTADWANQANIYSSSYTVLDLQTDTQLPNSTVNSINLANSAVVRIFRASSQAFQIGNLSVPTTTKIVADGEGYAGGVTPSANGSGPGGGAGSVDPNGAFGIVGGAGGSHGGEGGSAAGESGNWVDSISAHWFGANLATPYGNPFAPTTLGSGGGAGSTASYPGGVGGGAIHLVVNDTLTLGGTISANGATGSGDSNSNSLSGGGGAGGSVWLEVGTLSGTTGNVLAEGGSVSAKNRHPGGGGRIAIYSNNFNSSSTGVAVSASGQNSNGISQPGGPGSVFYYQRGVGNELVFKSKYSTVMRGGYDLSQTTGLQSNTLDKLTIDSSLATTNVKVYGTQSSQIITNVNIGSSASLNVDYMGYQGGVTVTFNTAATGSGPGGGLGISLSRATGGSHGGLGGFDPIRFAVDFAKSYGNPYAPTSLGSGGGVKGGNGAGVGQHAGSGGGAMRFTVAGTLTVNGRLSANGEPSLYWDAGGAGGSIFITATTITGTGKIQANGGDGVVDAGGGGGGRIALYYTSIAGFSGAISAAGGKGVSSSSNVGMVATVNGYYAGGPGTIYYAPSSGAKTLRISNHDGASNVTCNMANCWGLIGGLGSAGAVNDPALWSHAGVDIEVRDTAKVNFQSVPANMYINNLTVRTGSQISSSTLGYLGSSALETAGAPASSGAGGLNGFQATTIGNGKSGSGGGHAGSGGGSTNASGNVAGGTGGYLVGTETSDTPTSFGAGGGGNGDNVNSDNNPSAVSVFNNGGGSIYLNVQNTITVEASASINSDGGAGLDHPNSGTSGRSAQGGGAGGSLWISTGTLAGAGTVSAKGGKGGNVPASNKGAGAGGGGGGGRLSVTATTTSGWSGTYDVTGGAGGTYSYSAGTTGGAAGTTGGAGTKRLNGANAP